MDKYTKEEETFYFEYDDAAEHFDILQITQRWANGAMKEAVFIASTQEEGYAIQIVNALNLEESATQLPKEAEQWVKCEDALPEDITSLYVSCLVYTSFNERDVCMFNQATFQWNIDEGKVTHWMPLPQAPTKD
jgi:Protein of unknown function (DUF551)